MNEIAHPSVLTAPLVKDANGARGSAAFTIRGAVFGYGDGDPALKIAELNIERGERIALIGPSGSAKTTLLKGMAGLVPVRSGSLGRNPAWGEAPSKHEHKKGRSSAKISMIFQNLALVPQLTALENALLSTLGRNSGWHSLAGWFAAADVARAHEILEAVGLGALKESAVRDLSRGEAQRVAIARSLMQRADLVLADEPVSHLDPRWAEQILQTLIDDAGKRGATLVVSLHQSDLAQRMLGRILGLNRGKIDIDSRANRLGKSQLRRLYSPAATL